MPEVGRCRRRPASPAWAAGTDRSGLKAAVEINLSDYRKHLSGEHKLKLFSLFSVLHDGTTRLELF